LTYRLVRRLQRYDPAVWESIGRPTPPWAAFGYNDFGLQRLLISKEYSRLDDPLLARIRLGLGLVAVVLALVIWNVSQRSPG
jgi:hypothetical protein